MNNPLPSNIKAISLGIGESDYDRYGNVAPIAWVCGCGHRLPIERMDYDTGEYVPVSQDLRDYFLAEHTGHAPVCYKCQTTQVSRVGAWCQPCSDREDGI